MAARSDRLKRILRVQEQLKSLHEMRHAAEMRAAFKAGGEADEIAARKDGDGTLSGLFPDLYEKAIVKANETRERHLRAADVEAGKIATETVRTKRVAADYRRAIQGEERAGEERDALETVERLLGLGPVRSNGSD